MNKNYKTIIRQEKIKTWSELHNRGAHNNRLKTVNNSDNNRGIKRLLGTNNTTKDVKRLMMKNKIDPDHIRKNAVICNELILTISPDYFKNGELDYRDTFNKKATIEFQKRAVKFLLDKYKNKIASIVVHYDETSPHIHAIVVPIYFDKKTNRKKLSAKRFFDRSLLVELQEDYYNYFSDLEKITKYTHKSNAKHQDIKTFYGKLSEKKEEINNITLGIKAKNKKLMDRIKTLNNEKNILEKELYSLEKKNSKLNDALEVIFKILNSKAPSLVAALPKFVKEMIEYFNQQNNKKLNIIKKLNNNKSMVHIDTSSVENKEKELNESNNKSKVRYTFPPEKKSKGKEVLDRMLEEERRKNRPKQH